MKRGRERFVRRKSTKKSRRIVTIFFVTAAPHLRQNHQNSCIIASIVFLHDYKQTQAATAFLVLLLAFYAHLYYRPYDLASDRDQDGHASGRDSHRIKKELLERARVSERLERYSLGVLLLTILSSFYFMGNELPRDGIESNFIGWSVILINILYLAVGLSLSLSLYLCGVGVGAEDRPKALV